MTDIKQMNDGTFYVASQQRYSCYAKPTLWYRNKRTIRVHVSGDDLWDDDDLTIDR